MRWPFTRTRIPPAPLLRTLQGEPKDLGFQGGSQYRGIWASCEGTIAVERFVHRQFLENARAYAASYGKGGARTEVFERMLSVLHIDPSGLSSILELGAGHGNSVASLRELSPHAHIIASDVSPEMLLLLKHAWKSDMQVIPFQCNAEQPPFRDESFDLIVAWGVLHHLYDPAQTIAACGRILKPGGAAIFTEPMESGHRALTDLYRRLLADERYEEIDPRA
jgi:2-polyprenyl-3-methyl-5-hydroxy-6-metoxy-1,4-benzoquinol methylase